MTATVLVVIAALAPLVEYLYVPTVISIVTWFSCIGREQRTIDAPRHCSRRTPPPRYSRQRRFCSGCKVDPK